MSQIEGGKGAETEQAKDRAVVQEEGEKVEDRNEPDLKSVKKGKGDKVKRAEDLTKPELLKKLRETEEEAQRNYDLYMRAYAEMENIKKRGIKEREELSKYANESLIREILPVIDSLQKAISHAHSDENPSGLIEGLNLTLDSLMKTLEKAGLQEVEAEGKPFDPNFHEAIYQQTDDKVPPGHVVTEFQRGYLLNGRLIRPATVVISQGNTEKAEETV
jgi:molecular chaperone GrpE